MSVAQGQITIIDYNDAITLTGFINSNLQKTQMYNPDNGSYTPDWSNRNLVLTPSLYVAGTTSDLIASTGVQSVKWFENQSTTAIVSGDIYVLSGSKNHILTIKGNVMAGEPGVDYRCEITYLDSTTQLELKHVMSISFSRTVNGSGIVALIVSTPDGNVFKNSSISQLVAKAELWRGSLVDNTNVAYQWYKMDSTVTSDEGAGIGWDKLTDTAGKYSGSTTNTLTIYSDAVDSHATFRCIAKDTDTTSSTYDTAFMDAASFIDNSDPIQVIIESTGGDIFKNGEGSTVLTAKLFQAGVEIDADVNASKGTYTWRKYDSSGTLVSGWEKTGKTLSVGSNDVDVKSTFICIVDI